MKNTNTAFDETVNLSTGMQHKQYLPGYQGTNDPIYLKDGFLKYQNFIEERRKNIERLNSLKLHMEVTGKICPKAWHWGRFYKFFQPMHESYWLSSWWETTDDEKQHRFDDQLDYLVTQTIRFREAYEFLLEIEDRNWHRKTETPAFK